LIAADLMRSLVELEPLHGAVNAHFTHDYLVFQPNSTVITDLRGRGREADLEIALAYKKRVTLKRVEIQPCDVVTSQKWLGYKMAS
jgi:hypothetical protein